MTSNGSVSSSNTVYSSFSFSNALAPSSSIAPLTKEEDERLLLLKRVSAGSNTLRTHEAEAERSGRNILAMLRRRVIWLRHGDV